MSLALASRDRREAIRLALRCRLFTFAANLRLNRVDRLLKAGDGREARRVMAAVKRDVDRHRDRLDRRN